MLLLSVLSLAIVAYQATVVNSANILVFSAIGSHSTRLSEWPLMEALADRNHSVTYVSALKPFELDPKKKSKIKTYEPKKWTEAFGSWDQRMSFYEMRKQKQVRSLWYGLVETAKLTCELLYDDQEFVDWVKSNKFDLVIIDTSSNECVLGMIHHWKAKHILYGTTTYMPWYVDAFGLPDESSSIVNVAWSQMMHSHPNGLSFLERLRNAWENVMFTWIRENDYLPRLEEITRKGLGYEATKDMPSFAEMERNTNLVLLTTHFALDDARAFPPHVIPVGGNVISKDPKPLPQDIKTFLDESKNFVYVSFGTVADFTHFDEQVQINFINALGQFPNTRFLWKSQTTINVTDLPENVLVAKWVPQQSVLAHPKIKGYVSHSGMGSTVEALHFKVPLICIPVLAEQDYVADITEKRGACIKVEILDMEQEHLANAIKELLHNKKYKENMDRLSKIYFDRPAPALETAIFWVEYILRHDNTNEFLLPPSTHQRWWQRRLIDVWLFSAAVALAAVLVPTAMLYYFAKKLLSNDNTDKENRSRKQKMQ